MGMDEGWVGVAFLVMGVAESSVIGVVEMFGGVGCSSLVVLAIFWACLK